MKVFVQWAKSTPGDWSQLDHADWDGQDRRPADGALDDRPGLIAALNVHGRTISAEEWDHIALRPHPSDGIRVFAWKDAGDAAIHTFREFSDPAIGGRRNTKDFTDYYTDQPESLPAAFVMAIDTLIHARDSFIPPQVASRFDCRTDNAAGHAAARGSRGARNGWGIGL